jgi:hypothetical protein
MVHGDQVERLVVEARDPQRVIDQLDQPVGLIGRPLAPAMAERLAGGVAQSDRTH